METRISEDIIEQATKCERQFACLSGEDETLCKITYMVADRLYFLECTPRRACGYQVPFGDRTMCTCPVRRAIYDRYGVCQLPPEPLLSTKPLPEEELPGSHTDPLRLIIDSYEEAKLPATATALRIVVAWSNHQVLFPLPAGEITLGRADASRGAFPDLDLTPHGGLAGGVSRHHAKILHMGNHLFVEDVGSANGTFLNGRRIRPHMPYPLREGDTLHLAMLKLLVEFD